ncbi:hypothetical protein LJC36_04300, partial [Desulfovibrio sp. OttesenSCG-928-C14]|nr:hypothetical protein [Desulfovibrio sp. OttesenSCG-928-C14]
MRADQNHQSGPAAAGRKRAGLFTALGLALLLLASCSYLPFGGKSTISTPRGPVVIESSSLTMENVRQAYNEGRMQEAEALALALLKGEELDSFQRLSAWQIAAQAALAYGNGASALNALDQWKALDPSAASTENWNDLWRRSLDLVSFMQAAQAVQKALASPTTPPRQAREGKLFMAERRLLSGSPDGVSRELEDLYSATPSAKDKGELERRLFRALHRTSPGAMETLLKQATDRNSRGYPYALYRLEEARRLFLDSVTQALAKERVAFMRQGSTLADQALFQTWNRPDFSVLEGLRANNQEIALVLPLSGQYGNLAQKIVSGTEIARNAFAFNGQQLRFYVIDSDQPGWLERLASLPARVRVVGGPLRAADYAEIKNAGLLNQRFFFGFMPRLEEGDEGRVAWRFFSTNRDQLSAVIRFAASAGVTGFAAMVPEEEYGLRMQGLFQEELGKEGFALRAQGSYPVGQHQEWNKIVAAFLHTDKNAETAPNTPFQAIFLPDSWRNAQLLMPHFFYYRENRLLFMGSMLWEQSMSLAERSEGRNQTMVIFPGAWDANTTSPSGMLLRLSAAAQGHESADFWLSLGYDFALMAATVALPPEQGSLWAELGLGGSGSNNRGLNI